MLSEPFGKFPLRLGSLKEKISEDGYFEICRLNEMLLIERNQNGDWEIQSINGGRDSLRTAALSSARTAHNRRRAGRAPRCGVLRAARTRC